VQKLANLKIVEARREHCEQIKAHTKEAKTNVRRGLAQWAQRSR
jgi:hypothetical protein